MSLSTLGSVTTGPLVIRSARSGPSGFVPPVAVGQGNAGHGQHSTHGSRRETGAVGTPAGGTAPAHTLAADTRALVGDVFGALGAANTPTATTARQAVEAYRQTG